MGYYLYSGDDRFVVQFRPNQVGRVVSDLKGVQSLKGRWKSCSLHVGELVREDGADGELVVHVVREVHEDGVGDDVWVFGRVDSYKVLVVDEDGTVWRRYWGKGEEAREALEVLTSRGMVKVKGVDLEEIVSVDCRRVDIFSSFFALNGASRKLPIVREVASVEAGRRLCPRLIRCWVMDI